MQENHNKDKYRKYQSKTEGDDELARYKITEEQKAKKDAQDEFKERYQEKTTEKSKSKFRKKDKHEHDDNKDRNKVVKKLNSTSKKAREKKGFTSLFKPIQISDALKRVVVSLRGLFHSKEPLLEEEIQEIKFKKAKDLSNRKTQKQKMLERIAHLAYIQEYHAAQIHENRHIQTRNITNQILKHERISQERFDNTNSIKKNELSARSLAREIEISQKSSNKKLISKDHVNYQGSTPYKKTSIDMRQLYHPDQGKAVIHVSYNNSMPHVSHNNSILKFTMVLADLLEKNLKLLAENLMYNTAATIKITINLTLGFGEHNAENSRVNANNDKGFSQYTEYSKLPTSYIDNIIVTKQAVEKNSHKERNL